MAYYTNKVYPTETVLEKTIRRQKQCIFDFINTLQVILKGTSAINDFGFGVIIENKGIDSSGDEITSIQRIVIGYEDDKGIIETSTNASDINATSYIIPDEFNAFIQDTLRYFSSVPTNALYLRLKQKYSDLL